MQRGALRAVVHVGEEFAVRGDDCVLDMAIEGELLEMQCGWRSRRARAERPPGSGSKQERRRACRRPQPAAAAFLRGRRDGRGTRTDGAGAFALQALEFAAQIGGGLVAKIGVLFKAALGDLTDQRGKLGADGGEL